jgi:hypothetical protein
MKIKKLTQIKINDDYTNVYLGNIFVFRIEKNYWNNKYEIHFISLIKRYYFGSTPEDDLIMLEDNDNNFDSVDEAFNMCHKLLEKFVNELIEIE